MCLYQYFPDKDAVLVALAEHGFVLQPPDGIDSEDLIEEVVSMWPRHLTA